MPPAVELLQGGLARRLSPGVNHEPLREEAALVTISGACSRVLLNGKPLPLQAIAGVARVASIDLANRPGLHRISIEVGASKTNYDFVTDSAKATWREIVSMVAATREFTILHGRPFTYLCADSFRSVPDDDFLVAWLRSRIDEIVHLSTAIDRTPASDSDPRLRTSTRSKGLDRRATSALLRQRPALLEEAPAGTLLLAGKNYWPSLVCVRTRETLLPQGEHRQLRTFLDELLSACQARGIVANNTEDIRSSLNEMLRLRNLSPAKIGVAPMFPSFTKSAVERRDGRYGRLREIMIEFRSKFSTNEDTTPAIQTAINDVWQIYQAFAAYTIGQAFDLRLPSNWTNLRTRWPCGASMKGNGKLLYYDKTAPAGLLPSWRSSTSRPAFERPDITLVDELKNRVMILDVKYSIEKAGRCRAEHLFEMQGYLNSFGVNNAAIVFPGEPSAARSHSAGDYTLAEIPLRARDMLDDCGKHLTRLRSQLEGLWSPLSA